ncbi:DUF1761 domain-containing protein [Zobellia roscoffensis]|uniref:DUF1761 domain-containing protein n=1 Tax=Zobellia roscoffensis TaxID=2779508 RepID=UPI00188CB550|nr:DUF1761 domain-containing protein [Zobellia roscoffensis]
MNGFLGFLTLALFIALIVGLIKPSIILRWSKKPTRLKVIGFWFIGFIGLGVIAIATANKEEMAKSNIESANKYIKEGKYENAISDLKNIEEDNPLYQEAQELLQKTDSLSKLTEEEKLLAEQAELAKAKEEEKLKQKEQLERELKAVNNGVDFSNYRETIESLQIELVLFSTWGNIINDGEKSEDPEIQKLAKQLKPKVVKMQVKEFPILRKEYAKIVAKKMWENDIEVSTSSRGNRHINFSGGVFAANKNKQEFQEQVNEVLTMFRFNQSRYRWYKGEDEYTSYTMYEGKDSELMIFDK